MHRDPASVIYLIAVFAFLVFQSSNFFYFIYSLLELSLQNKPHSLLISFISCHDW